MDATSDNFFDDAEFLHFNDAPFISYIDTLSNTPEPVSSGAVLPTSLTETVASNSVSDEVETSLPDEVESSHDSHHTGTPAATYWCYVSHPFNLLLNQCRVWVIIITCEPRHLPHYELFLSETPYLATTLPGGDLHFTDIRVFPHDAPTRFAIVRSTRDYTPATPLPSSVPSPTPVPSPGPLSPRYIRWSFAVSHHSPFPLL